jgi:hypothetical protein
MRFYIFSLYSRKEVETMKIYVISEHDLTEKIERVMLSEGGFESYMDALNRANELVLEGMEKYDKKFTEKTQLLADTEFDGDGFAIRDTWYNVTMVEYRIRQLMVK